MIRLIILLLTLGVLSGCELPALGLPGGELRGAVVAEKIVNWDFVEDQFVQLEVRPADPYSVELNYVVKDGALYIDPGEGRKWFEYLKQDLNVRVRFGDEIYPVIAVLVGKPGELKDFDPERFIYRLDSSPE
ncbi:MAG: hypothetical protein KUG79_06745 [Pseudomonadales bacterium]|nr:hypothetical protein [Pseudomonadales bacterium]